ncbi:YihY/virulence factor BrkB family protein [Rickettsiales bacterium]|nr:YihY/virulence factor BrkB family protein [Rickettsiales bacterium]|tara:strand:- start:7041 stop:7946 length:906 start_codon:yes stop_codon:yes gene_type:complete
MLYKFNYNKNSKITKLFRCYIAIPFRIFRISASDLVRQDGIEHAGYLAFLFILSLFPFLIFLISIIGLFGGSQDGVRIIQDVLLTMPKEMSKALYPRINEITSGPGQSFLTIAIIGVIWTASSSVEGCRTVLNRAYRVSFPPPYMKRRLISIIQFFLLTFSVILAMIIFIIMPKILAIIKSFLPFYINFESVFFSFSKLAIYTILFATTTLLYYILPNAKQKITQTFPGAILTVILWTILQKIFIFYISNFDQVNYVYGSLAGIIISLMFFYLVSLVFILGAEFNYHFHRVYYVLLKKYED